MHDEPTVLNGVDSAIGDFDHFIKSYEGRLQRSQLDEQLNGSLVVLLQLGQLLTTTGQTSQLVSISTILKKEEVNKNEIANYLEL